MRAAFCWSKANEVEGRNAGSVHSSPGLVVSSSVHACAETTSRAPSPDRASQRRMSVLMRSTSGLSTWQGAEGENGQAAVSRAERNRRAAQRCFTAVAWCRSWAPIRTHCRPSTAHPSTANRSALPATKHPHLPRLLAVQEGLDAARNLAGVLVVAQAHGRAKLHGWGGGGDWGGRQVGIKGSWAPTCTAARPPCGWVYQQPCHTTLRKAAGAAACGAVSPASHTHTCTAKSAKRTASASHTAISPLVW